MVDATAVYQSVLQVTLRMSCSQIDTATLEVTELPVKKWTQDYKEYLETLIKPESKVEWAYALTSLRMLPERHMAVSEPCACRHQLLCRARISVNTHHRVRYRWLGS